MKPRKKHPKKALAAVPSQSYGWIICGWDTSSSGIAGAAIAYDKTLGKIKGPVFYVRRWGKDYHYYDRLKDAAKSHEMMLALEHELGIFRMNLSDIYIAQEEPWPLGMVTGRLSNALKQQAEMSGAFLGGLVRYGFQNIAQMNSMTWRGMVARDLGITTHHSKWKDPALCEIYNCKPDATGKFRTKQWSQQMFGDSVPDWPDMIDRKEGRIPRPEDSMAKAVQPDDRYDALAVMWAFTRELAEGVLQEEVTEAVKKSADKKSRVRKALSLT